MAAAVKCFNLFVQRFFPSKCNSSFVDLHFIVSGRAASFRARMVRGWAILSILSWQRYNIIFINAYFCIKVYYTVIYILFAFFKIKYAHELLSLMKYKYTRIKSHQSPLNFNLNICRNSIFFQISIYIESIKFSVEIKLILECSNKPCCTGFHFKFRIRLERKTSFLSLLDFESMTYPRKWGGKKETEVWGKVEMCAHDWKCGWFAETGGDADGRGKVAELTTHGRRTHFRLFCFRARRRQSTFCLRQYVSTV